MTEKEIFDLFDLYGTDMGDYYEIEVGRIERLIKEIEFQSAPKDLTDEEIRTVIDEHWEKTSNVNLFDFARAILRKAQEK